MMSITPQQFLADLDSLVSLPDICFQVNQLADNPTSNAKNIADVVSQDPNLVAQVLRIANSPYYGFPSRVDTIMRAISVIGIEDLRNLVLSTSVINAFSAQKNELVDLKKYWTHSLFAGFAARQLCRLTTTKVLDKERFFVAGLLHDIGQLVLSLKAPEIMKVIIHRSKQEREPFYKVEEVVFGIGHCELGAELLKKWQLPDSLQAVAAFHHDPEKSKDYALEVSVIHIANALAHKVNISGLGNREQLNISEYAWKITGLTEEKAVLAVDKAKAEFVKTLPVFMSQITSSAV